jgi:O-methyltransferase involved in polyketide biosynthesis
MTDKTAPRLTGIPETLLIPLFIRARETGRSDALLKDDKAVELVGRIAYDFSRIKLQQHDILGLILRVREFDRFVRKFLEAHPDGVVVHIGCGLDARFERLDNGRVEWFDLDLPEVIRLRQELMPPASARCHLLATSVFDPGWMEALAAHRPGPVLFVVEGVFPFFEAAQLRALLQQLRSRFPGAELVFDAHAPWVMHSDNLQLALSGVKARLRFGLRRPRDVESWAEGIRLLEEWYYFGTAEPRVRPYRWMYRIPFLRRSTGIFHYLLGESLS